jgi:hypothetical protein
MEGWLWGWYPAAILQRHPAPSSNGFGGPSATIVYVVTVHLHHIPVSSPSWEQTQSLNRSIPRVGTSTVLGPTGDRSVW